MKIGDLVKHPEGMVNVNAKMYSLGIILKIEELRQTGLVYKQCHVLWSDMGGAMAYSSTALEVISEAR